MTLLLALSAAFYAALAGSGHCAAMCGGIAAATTGTTRWSHGALIHLGRIGSYAAAGAIGGALLGSGSMLATSVSWQPLLSCFAGLLLMLMALQLRRNSAGPAALERLSHRVWQRVFAPWAKRLHSLPASLRPLAVGALWGWLPCGLVYAALPLAWTMGSAHEAALVMVAFGLGTSPVLIAFGAGIAGLRRRLQQPRLRYAASAVLFSAGALTFGMSAAVLAQSGAAQPTPLYCTAEFPQTAWE